MWHRFSGHVSFTLPGNFCMIMAAARTQQWAGAGLFENGNRGPQQGCWVLTAAILFQKLPGSVKLTCPENLCHIRRRLENWKPEDLAYQGYTYIALNPISLGRRHFSGDPRGLGRNSWYMSLSRIMTCRYLSCLKSEALVTWTCSTSV